ncbi:MAG: SIR2 family protein, partial [Ferruginibacter sp.]
MKAKKGIHYSKAKGLLNISGKNLNWTLVIGAGISSPLFPTWPDLIRSMFTDVYNSKDLSQVNTIIESFPLDSILQSLKNYSTLSDEEFTMRLSEILYKTLWDNLDSKDRKLIFRILANPIPGGLEDKIWGSYFEIMKDKYSNYSFYKVAETLYSGYLKGIKPASIISFNAEPLLYATLASLIREYYEGKKDNVEKRKQRLDIVTRSISSTGEGRIPFYHIHGYLPVPYLNKKTKKSLESPDKLVFSETEYLNLANSNFSWQSSVFLHSSYSSNLIFLGLSFSDLNLRKWLSWTYSNRVKEIQQFNPTA